MHEAAKEPDAKVDRYVDGSASIAIDASYDPVVIVTWRGAPTHALLDDCQAWIDRYYERARARGSTGAVFISDGRTVRLPNMAIRRRISELSHDPELLLKIIAVIPAGNAMVRGAIAAILWVIGDNRRHALATSFAHAVDQAAATFKQHGLTVPDQLEELRARS